MSAHPAKTTDTDGTHDTEHVMYERTNRDGPAKRILKTVARARTLATLLVCLLVVTAGCTGIGGLGGDGGAGADGVADTSGDDGNGDGAGDDGSDADAGDDGDGDEGSDSGDDNTDGDSGGDAGSVFDEESTGEGGWFNLSEPGYYEFELAGIDDRTGEQVTGHLVYDVEAAGDGEVTTSVDYRFGSEEYQSSATGSPDEVSAQLFLTPAHAPVLALQGVSLTYLFEMGLTDPTVGNRKSTTTDEGTQVTEVVEMRSYAGLECFFVRTTLDGEVTQEGCIRSSEGGIAPYAAYYADDGELELRVELVEFERR